MTAAASASPVSRLPGAMLSLLHAFYLYRHEPSTAGLERVFDVSRDVMRGQQLADVKGSA